MPDHDENTPPSPQTPYDRARDTLRSLREDIVIFQDPDVRNYLETIPSNTPIETPSPSRPPEELHAVIIALRTRLNDTIDELNSAKSANLQSRKRAARAEGEVSELRNALSQRDRLHQDAIADASETIDNLERDRIAGHTKLQQEALLIRQDAERDRVSKTSLRSELDGALAETASLQEQVSSLHHDASATDRRHHAEVARLEAEAGLQSERMKLLEAELNEHRAGKTEIVKLGTDEVSSARARAESLQREAVQIKSDLQWRTRQNVRLQQRLEEVETDAERTSAELQDTRKRLDRVGVLEEEVRLLRETARTAENTSGNTVALLREKSELTRLIRTLTPSGKAQDGLRILQDIADGKVTTSRHATGRERRPLGVRHEDTIAELQKTRAEEVARLSEESSGWKARAKAAEEKLLTAEHGREAVLSANRKSERMRLVLRKENEQLRATLGDLETHSAGPTKASHAPSVEKTEQMKEQREIGEGSDAKRKTLIADMEDSLRKLASENAELKDKLVLLASSSKNLGLPSSASEAHREHVLRKAVREANEAQVAAEERARKFSVQMSELQTELRSLQLKHTSSLNTPSCDLRDFDASTVKVLHIRGNPLAVAMEKEAKEKEKSKGKKRLRVDSAMESPPVSGKDDAESVASLETRIAELEKLNQSLERSSKVGIRTKEIALKRIEEVRSAVYNIFGWSMKVVGAKYVISSIYAEGPREVLEFGLNPSGTMSLLETEYAARLSDEIEQYVHRMNSFPALLAHVTMENFEKTTAAP